MDPLLNALTLAPTSQLFELEPPKYTSSYGRRTEAIFKHNVPPAPMLLSPDNGLVLYERVISTKAEHQLLDKLTKPKFYHPIPNIKRRERKGSAHATNIGGASSGSPPRARSASRRPPSAPGQPTDASGAAAAARGVASNRDRGAQQNSQPHQQAGQQHRPSRSHSAGKTAAGSSGHPARRKPLYPEDGQLKDYFSKERASVTATTMFTWGNRYRLGECGIGRGCGGGGGGGGGGSFNLGGSGSGGRGGSSSDSTGFSSYAPTQTKPPLRL